MNIKLITDDFYFNTFDIPKFIKFPECPSLGDKLSILSFTPFDNNCRESLQDYLTKSNLNANAEVIERIWQSTYCDDEKTNVYLLIRLKFHPEQKL